MPTVTRTPPVNLITVADLDSLPDPATVSRPTLVYVESEDDYVGVFQA